MSSLKKLAGQTAIYGLSSIIGRFLNYLLVPIYVSQFDPAAFGVVTEFYAYVGFLIVVLTYGMETALFRFINKDPNPEKVYSTALISMISSSAVFMVLAIVFSQSIATAMRYPEHADYIVWFALILGFDAISALPFAKLRAEGKATAFATIKLINIGANIGLNLFFVLVCKEAFDHQTGSVFASLYNPNIGVAYQFVCNLAASTLTLVLLLPWIRGIANGFDAALWKKMLNYGWPLIAVGLAGIVNETLDRALLKYLLPYDNETNMWNLGVYGANYKLAMLMSLGIQAFRYAAEPFFFEHAKEGEGGKQIYARVLNYFVGFGALAFLVISLYINLFKYFIPNKEYWSGLNVVPILLMANLFLGVYINLSIWYKLTDRTKLGALVSLAGAAITIVLNVIWIPTIGYVGSAWATLIVYVFMSVASYVLGRKYFPVPYQVGKVLLMIGLALLLFWVDQNFVAAGGALAYGLKAVLLLVFVGGWYGLEKWPVGKVRA